MNTTRTMYAGTNKEAFEQAFMRWQDRADCTVIYAGLIAGWIDWDDTIESRRNASMILDMSAAIVWG